MSTYTTHKKAHFDYEILETFEAGVVLSGIEVKSIRLKKARLEGAFVIVRGGEPFVVGLDIPPYQPSNTPKKYEADKARTLLLSKKEIAILDQKTNIDRLTAIPIKLYNKNRKIKLEIAIVRGKKKFDKRETLKARDTKRDIERTLKSQF